MHAWIDRRPHDEKFTAIIDGEFIVDGNEATDFSAALSGAMEGRSVDEFLSDDAVHIPLSRITRVESEPGDGVLTIHYYDGSSKESEFQVYESAARRDEVLDALRKELGGDFEDYVDAYTPLRAAFAPLAALVVTWFLVFVFHGVALDMAAGESVDTSGRNSFIKKVMAFFLDLFGPTGVVLLGYVVTAVCLWKFYTRAVSPPVRHWLQSTPHVPVAGWRLGARYAALGVVAAVTLRAMVLG